METARLPYHDKNVVGYFVTTTNLSRLSVYVPARLASARDDSQSSVNRQYRELPDRIDKPRDGLLGSLAVSDTLCPNGFVSGRDFFRVCKELHLARNATVGWHVVRKERYGVPVSWICPHHLDCIMRGLRHESRYVFPSHLESPLCALLRLVPCAKLHVRL